MDFNFESNFLNSHFADINGILCQIFWNIDLLQGSPFAVYSKTILPILPKICSKNCKILLKIILIGGMEDNSKVQQVQQVLSLTNLETAKNQNRSKKLEIRKICFKILLFLDTWNIAISKRLASEGLGESSSKLECFLLAVGWCWPMTRVTTVRQM